MKLSLAVIFSSAVCTVTAADAESRALGGILGHAQGLLIRKSSAVVDQATSVIDTLIGDLLNCVGIFKELEVIGLVKQQLLIGETISKMFDEIKDHIPEDDFEEIKDHFIDEFLHIVIEGRTTTTTTQTTRRLQGILDEQFINLRAAIESVADIGHGLLDEIQDAVDIDIIQVDQLRDLLEQLLDTTDIAPEELLAAFWDALASIQDRIADLSIFGRPLLRGSLFDRFQEAQQNAIDLIRDLLPFTDP